MTRVTLITMLIMIFFTTTLMACAGKRVAPGLVPVTMVSVDDDCYGAPTLERDLSDDGVYRGNEQIYLNDEGRSCRYAQ